MRRFITGRVGEPPFEDALRLLRRGDARLNLAVWNGTAERILHLSEGGAWVLALPAEAQERLEGEPLEAARRRVQEVLAEAASWTGALFELREGPPGEPLTSHPYALRLQAPARALLEGLESAPVRGAEDAGPRGSPGADPEPGTRVEDLLRRFSGVTSKGLVLRDLARAWVELGSPRRAAACLRDLARHYEEWGAEDQACQALEKAIELCPWDAGAVERLAVLHQSAGRQAEAERAVEALLAQLGKLRLHEAAVRAYEILERPAESPSLRALAAEACVRCGDPQRALKELRGAARILESRGDAAGAASVLERVAELVPGDAEAQAKARRLRRSRLLHGALGRSAALGAAALVAVAWLAWDATSALAFGRLKASGDAVEPRRAIDLLRPEAASYPGSRHAARLANREAELYWRSLQEDVARIQTARAAQAAGDLEAAGDLLDAVCAGTLIPPLAAWAAGARQAIAGRRAREDALLAKAARHVQAGDLAAAFGAYREILRGEHDAVTASSHQVPVFVETVPEGASIRVDGKACGRAPGWVFLPPDPCAVLELSSPGCRTERIEGPLLPLLATGEPALRKGLLPEAAWHVPGCGGRLAAGGGPGATVLAVLGSDGVLRGLDAATGKPLWEAPLEAEAGVAGDPRVVEPVVLLGTSGGCVLAHALSSGKRVWTARASAERGAVVLGPPHAGQALVACAGGALLLSPRTGLAVRRMTLPGWTLPAWCRLEGDAARFGLPGGRVAAADLRAGRWLDADDGAERVEGAGAPRRDAAWALSSAGAVLPGGRTVAGSRAGAVECFDAATGELLWRTALRGAVKRVSGPEDGADLVVVHLERKGETVLTGLAVSTGRALWEVVAGRSDEETSARIERHLVVLSAPSLGVAAFRRADE